jgi:TolB-like protein
MALILLKSYESESILNYQAKNFSRKTPGFTFFRPARMIISSLKILIFLIFFLGLIPLSGAQTPGERQAAAKTQGPYKVAILPVAVHSPENLAFLREGLLDMLSSRMNLEGRVSVVEKAAVKKALAGVEGEIDAQKAMELGSRLGADYVVFGSLTKLGDSASLDLQILSVKGEKPPASVYVQARKMEEIINGVDEVARKADEKI